MGFLDLIGVRRAPDLTASVGMVDPVSAAALGNGAPLLQIGSPWALPGNLAAVVGPDVFGLTGTLPLTRARAMQVPAVARARHILCGSIARLPLRAYPLPAGTAPLPEELQPTWIARTDAALPPWHRMLWTVDDLFFTGFSLWRRTNDSPTDRKPRPLSCDRIDRTRWTFDPAGRIEVDGEIVDEHAVHLIIGPHEGLLNFAASAIRHAANLQAASDKAANTPAAQIDLHQVDGDPLTEPQIDDLIARWAAARRGENGGVSYSSKSIEVRELGSVEGHLLIEGRNAAAVDVARAAGLPASRLDAATGDSLTYATTRDNATELVDFGLSLYMGAISASLSVDAMTPRGTRVAFDLEELLPAEGVSVTDPTPDPAPTSTESEPTG